MKFNCEREAASKAVAMVAKYASRRGGIPILEHLLIEARDGKVSVTGTDLDRAASASFAADIDTDESICVRAETLSKALTQSTGSDVAWSLATGVVSVACGKSRMRLPALPREDFPELPMLTGQGDHHFPIPADTLARMQKTVGFAVPNDIVRPSLNGVHWKRDGEALRFVATDGKTLSILSEPLPSGLAGFECATVSPVSLPDWDGDVDVVISENFARFSANDASFAVKIVEGGFPEFERAIPRGNETSLIFDREELLKSLDFVSINQDGQNHSILLDGRDGTATISSENGRGEVSDRVPFDGPDFQIAFASHIIRPALAAMNCETVEMMYAPNSPGIFRKPNDDSHRLILWNYRDRRLDSASKEAA